MKSSKKTQSKKHIKEPIDDELIKEPLDEEPLDEEPLGEEPLDEEPLDEEPLGEELLDDELIDQPIDEEHLDEPHDEEHQYEQTDMTIQTEDVIDNDENCIEIDEPQFLKDDTHIPIVDAAHRTSKNKMTRYEFVRIKGERIMQLSKGAKPLIRKNKQSDELTYKEIAIEEIKTNMVPFKIKRFVKDHYEIWSIDELDKKHLEPLFH
jgi:DNA-directed RNA polymerase subunit K/omega